MGGGLVKKNVLKSFIKMRKTTCVKTIFSKIAGTKTATFLKMSILSLYS